MGLSCSTMHMRGNNTETCTLTDARMASLNDVKSGDISYPLKVCRVYACTLTREVVVISGCDLALGVVTTGLSSGLSTSPSKDLVWVLRSDSALILRLSLLKASWTVSFGIKFLVPESDDESLSITCVVGVEKFHRLECKVSISLSLRSNCVSPRATNGNVGELLMNGCANFI